MYQMFIRNQNSRFSQQSEIVHFGVAIGMENRKHTDEPSTCHAMIALSHLLGMVQTSRCEAKVQNTNRFRRLHLEACLALHFFLQQRCTQIHLGHNIYFSTACVYTIQH